MLAKDPDDGREHAVSVPYALKAKELRVPLMVVSLAMISQQISGTVHKTFAQSYATEFMVARHRCKCWCVWSFDPRYAEDDQPSPVLYYSNDILSNVIPGLGPYISILVTVVNVVMTFPPIFLIEVNAAHLAFHRFTDARNV